MHRFSLFILVFVAIGFFAVSTFAEDCNTNCGDQCRVIMDTLVFGRKEFVEPTCNTKCEAAKALAHANGCGGIPTIPLTPREQIERAGTLACTLPQQVTLQYISSICGFAPISSEDQVLITKAKFRLYDAKVFRPQDFTGYNGFCGSRSTPFIEPQTSKCSSQLSA